MQQQINQEVETKGKLPEWVVYKSGKVGEKLVKVGAIWSNTSKAGKAYMKLKINEDSFVAFVNEPQKK